MCFRTLKKSYARAMNADSYSITLQRTAAGDSASKEFPTVRKVTTLVFDASIEMTLDYKKKN